MGQTQSGQLTLVNGSPYDWHQSAIHSYQMPSWSFPSTIPSGKAVTINVQWDEKTGHKKSDDAGEVRYTLAGTSNSFEIQARANNGFNLQAFFAGIGTQNNVQGSTLSLGWKQDGYTNFILSGTQGNFSSSNPPVNWMNQNLFKLGSRPLRHICIPGTHDAGMSVLSSHTAFVSSDNVLTQTLSIGGQLQAGSRYFDLRPVISGGTYKTGHYSYIDKLKSWQGGNGQSFADIINQINAFTASNQELVILNLSHDLNTDVGNSAYRSFTPAEWNSLFQQLLGIKNLFVAPNPTAVDLTTLTLNQFIGNGKAAVVVIVEPTEVNLGSFATKGFYRYSQLNAFNSYSGTNNGGSMASDQLHKMVTNRPNPDSGYFILSWTLTQDGEQAVGLGSSILNLASQAYSMLFTQVINSCSKQTYPNVLYIDGMPNNREVVALAMAINNIAAS